MKKHIQPLILQATSSDGKDKIIIRQLQFANLGWEYTVKKEDNMKLVKLFEAIKSKEWGMNYLDNP
jgi:hypothetical protein